MILDNLREDYSKVLYVLNPKADVCPPQAETCGEKLKGKSLDTIGGLFTSMVLTSAVYFNLDVTAYANNFTAKAEDFYFGTFMNIAKWVIIIKGGWDVIAKALKEDFEGAKKSVVQYLVVFSVLMGLPWALEMVEDIFSGEA